jgi:hypothetical protein
VIVGTRAGDFLPTIDYGSAVEAREVVIFSGEGEVVETDPLLAELVEEVAAVRCVLGHREASQVEKAPSHATKKGSQCTLLSH